MMPPMLDGLTAERDFVSLKNHFRASSAFVLDRLIITKALMPTSIEFLDRSHIDSRDLLEAVPKGQMQGRSPPRVSYAWNMSQLILSATEVGRFMLPQ
jgi:hypothetical protein